MAKFEIKLTKEQQQAAVAAVLMTAAFGYIYYNYFWSPTAKKIAETTEKIEKTDRDIAEARRQAARLPQLRAQIEDLEAKATAAEKKLPKAKEIPGLIDTLSDLARQYDVTIVSFAPGGMAAQQYFTELPYSMSVRGSYHGVAKFLTALALQERIFHTRNLVLSPSRGSATETVSATFSLIAFQYKG